MNFFQGAINILNFEIFNAARIFDRVDKDVSNVFKEIELWKSL